MIIIDGKSYPLWSQFVEGKKDWIGGILEEFSDGIADGGVTTITDITLEKNPEIFGEEPVFTVHGKDFCDCFAVGDGGISTGPEEGWLYFHSCGLDFRIKKPV